jgi:hypothetical protein
VVELGIPAQPVVWLEQAHFLHTTFGLVLLMLGEITIGRASTIEKNGETTIATSGENM